MIATGPLCGHAVDTGLVIASTDPLAADVVGESDLSNVRFTRMSMGEAVEAFTAAAYGERLDFEHA